MPRPNGIWQVLPHGLLTRLADNLYTVNGQLDTLLGERTRRMTVVRLTGKRLAIFGAIALREEEMVKLEALGRPSYLIAPAGSRRLDVDAWLTRYPRLQLVDPSSSGTALEGGAESDSLDRVWRSSASQDPLDLGDPRVRLQLIPGTSGKEFAVLVATPTGKTLLINELIFNLPRARGYRATLMRLAGTGPAPTIPAWVRLKLIRDKAAVRSQLLDWAKLPGLERIVVCHGESIDRPRNALLQLASSLAGDAHVPAHAPAKASLSAEPAYDAVVPNLQAYAKRRAG